MGTSASMRAALYVRVSTVDKDRNPQTQLRILREHAEARGWTVTGEYVDHASAAGLRNRTAWRQVWTRSADASVTTLLRFSPTPV